MTRLTSRDEHGHAYFPQCFEDPCNGSGCQRDRCDFMMELCERLAQYEEIGLTPEQIRQVDVLYEEKCMELADEKKKHEWIPCNDRTPEDCDNRFYMCIVENHEEDIPMFCQYEEEYGFGFWHDIYNEETLGFVDTEFKTNEELGYEKVIAWRPLPEQYQQKEGADK